MHAGPWTVCRLHPVGGGRRGGDARRYEGEKRSACLRLREDDSCLALHKGGSDLQYNCFHSVGTAPTLRGEQFHANGPTCQHVATIEDWPDNTQEGRAIGELVIKDGMQENVVHPLCLFQLLHVLKERTVRVYPGRGERMEGGLRGRGEKRENEEWREERERRKVEEERISYPVLAGHNLLEQLNIPAVEAVINKLHCVHA